MAFADDIRTIAIDLIDEFGEELIFTRDTQGSYDSALHGYLSSSTATYTCFGVVEDYKDYEVGKGNIEANDRKLLIADVASRPRINDTVEIEDIVYRIVDIKADRVNGTDLVYTLQIRAD